MTWSTNRTVNGHAVQWHLGPREYVTFQPDQYGKVRHMSWPAKSVTNAALFGEVRDIANSVLAEIAGPPKGRFGDRFSPTRWRLCERIAAQLNASGVSPINTCQRPEGSK